MRSKSDMADHVTFCPQANRIMDLNDTGITAEWRTAGYLYDNLKEEIVGDYRILVNYNLLVRGTDVREIDLVVINRFGVFLLEVKGWLGAIQVYDDDWILNGTIKRDNAIESIQAKARIFHSQMFGSQGRLSAYRDTSVTGLVVFTEPCVINNESSYSRKLITGLNQPLLHSLSSTEMTFHKQHSRLLSDDDIERIYQAIHGKHQARRDELVENFRLIRKLRDGDLFEEYEAQNVNVDTQTVRLKRYKIQKLSAPQSLLLHTVRQFKRSVEVVSALGSHPNIVTTSNFFPDSRRPDIYYEITELVGERLDEIMAKTYRALSLDEQLDYLEPLCEVLKFAHNHKDKKTGRNNPIYHRNINPATIFVDRDMGTNKKIIKLADFDFAKYGQYTITREGEVLLDSPFAAPEVVDQEKGIPITAASDIYSLGVLWYLLACLPTHYARPEFQPEQAEQKIHALDLPAEARALMLRMVAPEPFDRPQKIEEVIAALRRLRQRKEQDAETR